MLRVNHCFRNCSTHSRDFCVVSGKSPSNDTAAGAAGVSATSSLVAEAADSFEAVHAPFKYASTSSFVNTTIFTKYRNCFNVNTFFTCVFTY